MRSVAEIPGAEAPEHQPYYYRMHPEMTGKVVVQPKEIPQSQNLEIVMQRFYRSSALLLLPLLFLTTFSLAQQVSLSATIVSFAPQLVGSTSASQELFLTNSGGAVLTVKSIVASGGYSVSNTCSELSPGESCTISVELISDFVGTNKGVITITDDAPSSPQIVTLSGSTLPTLTISPGQLNLGSVAVGATGQSKPVILTNHGPAFVIGSIAASGDYLQSNNCPATLANGASCTVNVAVHPTTSGAISGALSVTPAPRFPFPGVSAALSAVGAGGVVSHVSLQPPSLNFGNKSGFDGSVHSKTVTLTNTSSSTSLTFQDVSVNGPSSDFPVYQVESSTCQGMLAPGAQCVIVVSVANFPTLPASVPGALTIVDSDPTSPQVVGLFANELPEVSFSPATLTFAPQKVGTTSATKIVTLTSNLDSPGVSLLPLTVSGDYTVVAAGANPCGSIPGFSGKNAKCTVGVTFTPNRIGSIEGAVTFTLYPQCDPQTVLVLHEPCSTAQVINLTGTGN